MEHAMSNDLRSTKSSVRSDCPQLSRTQKAAMALGAVLVSSTLLGGVLGLFEMRSEEAAMARVKTAPSTDGLAVRTATSGPRG
jgi:hypothetical protein